MKNGKRIGNWMSAVCMFALLWAPAAAAQTRAGDERLQPRRVRIAAEPEAPRASEEQIGRAGTEVSALRMVKLSGVLKDELGRPRTGTVGLTIALYREAEGGAALWMESQNVEADEQGRYTLLLGATTRDGLPVEIFSNGEARWVGVQAQLPGAVEQPRAMLVSVPYALKAGDAETLGGLPASSFLRATREDRGDPREARTRATSESAKAALAAAATSGTVNYIAKFITSTDLGNSVIYETTAGNVGVNTTTPIAKFDVVSPGSVALRGEATASSGGAIGVRGIAASNAGAGIQGEASATTGATYGVRGITTSSAGTGVRGEASATTGVTYGVRGINSSASDGASGVLGQMTSTIGVTYGVYGINPSTTTGSAGVYGLGTSINGGSAYGVLGVSNNSVGVKGVGADSGVLGITSATGGGTGALRGVAQNFYAYGIRLENDAGGGLIIGRVGTPQYSVFRVDGTGRVFANGGFQSSGADFAESVEPIGEKSIYEPGDVLVIGTAKTRVVERAAKPYSPRVAGIYSTKPGVLATPHDMDDPRLAANIPLAVIGIVPCKVSAENGSIAIGDLLVTSETPGHAMKGTNRKKMLGAIVGKALQTFDPRDARGMPDKKATGVIEVLVTLQ